MNHSIHYHLFQSLGDGFDCHQSLHLLLLQSMNIQGIGGEDVFGCDRSQVLRGRILRLVLVQLMNLITVAKVKQEL